MTAYRDEIRTRLRDRAEQLRQAGATEDAELMLAAERHMEFTHQWYASRFERLNRMAREEFPEELCHRYFSVVANGIAEPHEVPTQAQIVNYERIRAELAEEKLAALHELQSPAGLARAVASLRGEAVSEFARVYAELPPRDDAPVDPLYEGTSGIPRREARAAARRAEEAEARLKSNTQFVLDFLMSGSGMCERHQEELRRLTVTEFIEREKGRGCSACAAEKLASILTHAKCAHCDKPAACFGSYEGGTPGFACDDCCGHGCEDGHCEPVRAEGT